MLTVYSGGTNTSGADTGAGGKVTLHVGEDDLNLLSCLYWDISGGRGGEPGRHGSSGAGGLGGDPGTGSRGENRPKARRGSVGSRGIRPTIPTLQKDMMERPEIPK